MKIADSMLGKKREHVVEKRNTRINRRLGFAINFQLKDDPGLARGTFNLRRTPAHGLCLLAEETRKSHYLLIFAGQQALCIYAGRTAHSGRSNSLSINII